MMLDTRANDYASSALPPSQDGTGSYLPDAVIAPMVQEAQKITPQLFQARLAQGSTTDAIPVIKDPDISYEKSKALILDALERFDPALADKARAVFEAGYDTAAKKNFIEDLSAPSLTESDSRWRLRQVEPGATRIMRSLEAQSEKTEFDPSNPNKKSVIQFEYDNTINSTIYLAHELGHTMADDFIRDGSGNKFGNNPRHLDEFQAYFVQNIVAEDLKHNADPAIANAAKEHFSATMATNLFQLPLGLAAIDAQKSGSQNNHQALFKKWFGNEWGQYAPAQKAAQEIAAEKISAKSKYMQKTTPTKLDDAVSRFHARPVGILLATGLVAQLQEKPIEDRHRIAMATLGADGPQNIADVLNVAGIKTQSDAQALCHAALEKTAQSILKTPSVTHNSRPAPAQSHAFV